MEKLQQKKDNQCSITIFDPAFNQLGHFGTASSVIFNRRLYGGGDFTMHIPFGEVIGERGRLTGAVHILKPYNIIVINKDPWLSGYVEEIEIDVDVYREIITVYGKTGQGIAGRRIVVPPSKATSPTSLGWERATGPSETVLKHFLHQNLEAPENSKRKESFFWIQPDQGRGHEMVWQARYAKLADELKGIGEYAGLGYEILANINKRRWEAESIHGLDRTADNMDGNEPVILDTDLKNIDGFHYREDRQSEKTVGYAGGWGTDEDRFVYILNPDKKDTARKEIFLDCGGAKDVNELIHYGQQKLATYQEHITLDVSVLQRTFILGKDYFLGDKVTVRIEDIGISNDLLLTAIEDRWQGGAKHRQRAIFGSESNPLELLKNKEEIR